MKGNSNEQFRTFIRLARVDCTQTLFCFNCARKRTADGGPAKLVAWVQWDGAPGAGTAGRVGMIDWKRTASVVTW